MSWPLHFHVLVINLLSSSEFSSESRKGNTLPIRLLLVWLGESVLVVVLSEANKYPGNFLAL